MNARTPMDILAAEYVPENLKNDQISASELKPAPSVLPLGYLKTPNYGDDPTELIQHRFLYRGGVLLLLGPTGVGKSALLMQMGIHFAVGRGIFELYPGTCYRESGMRVLLLQAENDEGDLAEMRDGVLAGCTDLGASDRERALEQMLVCTVCDRTGEKFAETLGNILKEHGPFDLAMVDPAFAYLGGDSNSQKDVSRFMRELLNPLLQKHSVGMILAHHTNKPLQGKEKQNWRAGDYAYLGAGSAEWINPARAALAIRAIGSDRVFQLRAPKRGRRLRWEDEHRQPTNVKYIAHSNEPGVICWREATEDEVANLLTSEKGGRPTKCDPFKVLKRIADEPDRNQAYYKASLAKELECSHTAIQNAINEGVREGCIRCRLKGSQKLYSIPEDGLKLVSSLIQRR